MRRKKNENPRVTPLREFIDPEEMIERIKDLVRGKKTEIAKMAGLPHMSDQLKLKTVPSLALVLAVAKDSGKSLNWIIYGKKDMQEAPQQQISLELVLDSIDNLERSLTSRLEVMDAKIDRLADEIENIQEKEAGLV